VRGNFPARPIITLTSPDGQIVAVFGFLDKVPDA